MKVICFNGHQSEGDPVADWRCECGERIMSSQEPWVQSGDQWEKPMASGVTIYKKQDEQGGWVYYSETNGAVFGIWSTTLNTFEEMIHIMNDYANP